MHDCCANMHKDDNKNETTKQKQQMREIFTPSSKYFQSWTWSQSLVQALVEHPQSMSQKTRP